MVYLSVCLTLFLCSCSYCILSYVYKTLKMPAHMCIYKLMLYIHLIKYVFNISNQIKSNQKSLLLSHHHSTSALVSEILMSVLQTVQKKKKQQTIYLWTDSAKKQQTIYLWTDSAKKQQTIYIWTDSAKKLHWSIYSAPDSAKKKKKKKKKQQFTYGQTVQKKTTAIYIWTDSAKKTTAIYIWTDSAKNNSNLHMDSTYLQTVQKTMCKIHIHILSTLSVL